jgi:hypothetical protein
VAKAPPPGGQPASAQPRPPQQGDALPQPQPQPGQKEKEKKKGFFGRILGVLK